MPSGIVLRYYPIVDLLDLLRSETCTYRFDDILVISFGIKSAVDGVIVDELLNTEIVIVENCVFACFLVLETTIKSWAKTSES